MIDDSSDPTDRTWKLVAGCGLLLMIVTILFGDHPRMPRGLAQYMHLRAGFFWGLFIVLGIMTAWGWTKAIRADSDVIMAGPRKWTRSARDGTLELDGMLRARRLGGATWKWMNLQGKWGTVVYPWFIECELGGNRVLNADPVEIPLSKLSPAHQDKLRRNNYPLDRVIFAGIPRYYLRRHDNVMDALHHYLSTNDVNTGLQARVNVISQASDTTEIAMQKKIKRLERVNGRGPLGSLLGMFRTGRDDADDDPWGGPRRRRRGGWGDED